MAFRSRKMMSLIFAQELNLLSFPWGGCTEAGSRMQEPFCQRRNNTELAHSALQRRSCVSHLLGRAIYLLNRDGNADPVLMTPQLITPTQRQIWRHLLCGDCEQRFSSRGEALIMRLVQRKTGFALLDRLRLAIPFSV